MKFCVWSLSRDLKIIEYIEYLSCISSEYFTSIAGAFVFPWTNKGSLVLYIARMRVVWHAMTGLKFGSCTVLSSSYLWLMFVTMEAESQFQIPSCASVLTVCPQYWQFFTTCTTATTQLLGIWCSVSYVLLFMTECINSRVVPGRQSTLIPSNYLHQARRNRYGYDRTTFCAYHTRS